MTPSARWLLLGALGIIFCLASFRAYIKVMEPYALFHPPIGLEMNPAMLGMDYKEVTIPSGQYRLNGWLIHRKDALGVVIFFHGNAENIAGRLDFVKLMAPSLKAHILLVDYRGYGKSEGNPTIAGIEEDGSAAVEWLKKTVKVPPSRIALWGFSLGGAAALAAAVKHPDVAGVVVESSFISMRAMATDVYPWLPVAFVTDGFDNQKIVSTLRVPKLFIHGDMDAVIPFNHGKALYMAAAEPKEFIVVRGAGHGDALVVAGKDYAEKVSKWIEGRFR